MFSNMRVPAVLLIDYDYTGPGGEKYYHTQADTIDKVSADSLGQVGRVMEVMLYQPTWE